MQTLILRKIFENFKMIVPKEELQLVAWPDKSPGPTSKSTLAVHINHINDRLEEAASQYRVKSKRGLGYYLVYVGD